VPTISLGEALLEVQAGQASERQPQGQARQLAGQIRARLHAVVQQSLGRLHVAIHRWVMGVHSSIMPKASAGSIPYSMGLFGAGQATAKT